MSESYLIIKNAHEHNLKHVNLKIPRKALTVITGVSGSGKSSLAYDTIYKEGQRRYLDSMSSYARQFIGKMERAQVDHIEGLSPTISIDQKSVSKNPRSTVGTITELYDFLRLLFSRTGDAYCPDCNILISGQTPAGITDAILKKHENRFIYILAPLVTERKGEYRKELRELYSSGFSRLRIDGKIYTDYQNLSLKRYEKHTLEIVIDRLESLSANKSRIEEDVYKALELAEGKCSVIAYDLKDFSKEKENTLEYEQSDFSTANACSKCGFSLPEIEPRLFSFNAPQGYCPECKGIGTHSSFHSEKIITSPHLPLFRGATSAFNKNGKLLFSDFNIQDIEKIAEDFSVDINEPWEKLSPDFQEKIIYGTGRQDSYDDFSGIIPYFEWLYNKYHISLLHRFMHTADCDICGGLRLNRTALSVLISGKNIQHYSGLQITDLKKILSELAFNKNKSIIAKPVITEIMDRIDFLLNVGLGYLTLNRSSTTLSGGESQRIRLAAQIGSGLEGCMYILDEPSIGLHQADNRKLLKTLKELRDRNNSVLIIEHDEETMFESDHIVDIGPGAGETGGRITYNGKIENINEATHSVTARYLGNVDNISIPQKRRPGNGNLLEIKQASQHNLKNINVKFPLETFICVTGVSGSGKSTLIMDTLKEAVQKNLIGSCGKELNIKKINGSEFIDSLIEIDQSPIGRTPRSNPATYTKAMDIIRDLFVQVPESRIRGYEKGRFSFNVKGGRCEHCSGAGVTEIDMQLFAPVIISCEICDGKRFNHDTLDIHYKGKNISQILEMSVSDALVFFKNIPRLESIFKVMCSLGLGYLRLGQPSPTLSGGEAQRIKLTSELRKRTIGHTLYILDEPTTGLHFDDIKKLLQALQGLVDNNNTIIVIEHNLDIIKSADYIIDLGPEGGDKGGQVIACGTPEQVAQIPDSPTGKELKKVLTEKKSNQKKIKSENKIIKKTEIKNNENSIEISGLRKNNLKNITLTIPKNKVITITGISGSGKSSLAFDTIFQEGQRKYIESLSTYVRRFLGRMDRVEVDKISGLSPTIAIDQRKSSHNPRSILATQTEIYDYFRVLYANLGEMQCPDCNKKLVKYNPVKLAAHFYQSRNDLSEEMILIKAPLYDSSIDKKFVLEKPDYIFHYLDELKQKGYYRIEVNDLLVKLTEDNAEKFIREKINKKDNQIYVIIDRIKLNPENKQRLIEDLEKAFEIGCGVISCVCRNKVKHYAAFYACFEDDFIFENELSPRDFSFNYHQGACETCNGIGEVNHFSLEKLITNPDKPLLKGGLQEQIQSFLMMKGSFYGSRLKRCIRNNYIDAYYTPFQRLPKKQRDLLIVGDSNKRGWMGLSRFIREIYSKTESDIFREIFESVLDSEICPSCKGGRLKPSILAVKLDKKSIADINRLTVEAAYPFFQSIKKKLDPKYSRLSHEILDEIIYRLHHMNQLGLDYIKLGRKMSTLSGGEAQRVRLSTQIGNKLKDVIYVLDEPTIGLHERDTEKMMQAIFDFQKRGNTVVIVEHDKRVIEESDWIVDIGPGAGYLGGNIIYNGDNFLKNDRKMSAVMANASFYPFLKSKIPNLYREKIIEKAEFTLLCTNVNIHNIIELTIEIPLNRFVCVSGVSGSGKSSLVIDFLTKELKTYLEGKKKKKENITFLKNNKLIRQKINQPVQNIIIIDQTPVSVSKRSSPVSYIGGFDEIRKLFAAMKGSLHKGFDPGHFSFNTKKGQCPKCKGKGYIDVEMHFLSDITITCDECQGHRYNRDVLNIYYKDKNIFDILNMTFTEAAEHFSFIQKITSHLQYVLDVGLGYLKLGVSTKILSGGELQRLKLAKELSKKKDSSNNYYILDEPTTGLHFQDIKLLIQVLDKLVKRNNSILIIEHNMDMLKNADYIIDMGPEGGDKGGKIIGQGTVEEIMASQKGYTSKYLSR